MIIHCHRNHHNDTYGWSCVPLVDWEKACWFDPECEETLAPDHKGEDREDHEGEFDGDYVEAENRVLGVNRKYWIAACCFKKSRHGPKSLLSSQNISKLLLGGEGSGPWGLFTERAFFEIWPTWIFHLQSIRVRWVSNLPGRSSPASGSLECKRFLVALGASLAELYPSEPTLLLVSVVIDMVPTSPISISSLLAPESSHSWLFDLLRLISCLIPVLCFLMAGGVASPCFVCEGGKAGGLRKNEREMWYWHGLFGHCLLHQGLFPISPPQSQFSTITWMAACARGELPEGWS